MEDNKCKRIFSRLLVLLTLAQVTLMEGGMRDDEMSRQDNRRQELVAENDALEAPLGKV